MTAEMTGPALRAWRRRCGFTQEQAGAAIGRHPRMIGKYEDATWPVPRTVFLACLATELGLTLPGVYDDLANRMEKTS